MRFQHLGARTLGRVPRWWHQSVSHQIEPRPASHAKWAIMPLLQCLPTHIFENRRQVKQQRRNLNVRCSAHVAPQAEGLSFVFVPLGWENSRATMVMGGVVRRECFGVFQRGFFLEMAASYFILLYFSYFRIYVGIPRCSRNSDATSHLCFFKARLELLWAQHIPSAPFRLGQNK